MRRYRFYAVALGVLLVILVAGSYAVAGSSSNTFFGPSMNGYEENPDVSTVAGGSFNASLSPDGSTLSYQLSYSGLEGTVQQAHIHFAKPAVNGGISIYLCANGNFRTGQRADLPECPQAGTVVDDVDMTAVVGPAAQGIEAGRLVELIAAMRLGLTYANVHSSKFPGGEIRAQIGGRADFSPFGR
jgi:hypothetical protein